MNVRMQTHELEVPGARITYDVRGDLVHRGRAAPDDRSPMDAGGFVTLASYFPDHTVVTYDPHGTGRSVRTDGGVETTPDDHASDLQHLIDALGGGPVDIFASSGGAVNALALVSKRPDRSAPSSPTSLRWPTCCPTRRRCSPTGDEIYRTYQQRGQGPAMAKFIAMIMQAGPLPESVRRPAGARPGDVRTLHRGRRPTR